MTPKQASSGGKAQPNLNELTSHYQDWFKLESDRLKLRLRQGLFKISLIPASLFVLAGLFLSALALFLYGSSLGLGSYFEGRPYLGFLLVGAVVLLSFLIAMGLLWFRLRRWQQSLRNLEIQTQEFRKAWKKDLQEIKDTLSGTLSVKTWTQNHPIPTAGAAMLVGITLAAPWSGSKKPEQGTEPMLTRMQIYATLLETGSQIIKDVLTPTLLELLHPKNEHRD